jgi:hypothetical protein
VANDITKYENICNHASLRQGRQISNGDLGGLGSNPQTHKAMKLMKLLEIPPRFNLHSIYAHSIKGVTQKSWQTQKQDPFLE